MILDAVKRWMGFGSNGSGGGGSPDEESPDMISCHDALSRIYEFLDGELDGMTNEQVQAHFDVCTRCYPHLASERSFKAALVRAMEGRGAPPDLKNRVLDLLSEDSTGR